MHSVSGINNRIVEGLIILLYPVTYIYIHQSAFAPPFGERRL